MKSLATRVLVIILFLASAAGLGAQTLRNTITSDNQSGKPALVASLHWGGSRDL